jgi:hypothetical protein
MTETRGSESSNRHQSPQQQDSDGYVQGLTPEQIQVLAQKVYDLLLEELRIEQERHGASNFGRGG